jgi:SAM-dependent methyltransferase
MRDSLEVDMVRYYAARAGEYDDWYLRRGRYSHGPESDRIWAAELQQAREWLAELPIEGPVVELAAGTGWWSPELARKGSLCLYDASAETLAHARARLAAQGLSADVSVRDAWAEPDRQVGGVFTAFWVSHVARNRLGEFLGVVYRWLEPGGLYALVDSRRDPESGAVDHQAPEDDVQTRRLDDGSTYRVRKVHYTAAELEGSLREAGFREAAVHQTDRFFLLGSARR